ncbi:MAG: flagellar biosynthesis anti-sigma factor FlgM [Gammaproteobacteria bacterium]|nr:flagellar biosynthesis anti-sigma factor FlgM [Gammaproteobacteria bacterium]
MAIEVNSNQSGPIRDQNSAKTQPAEAQQSQARAHRAEADRKTAQREDSVRISDDANSLRELAKNIDSQDSFDEAKVNEIKQAITEGRYPVNSRQLAENFLELESHIIQ